jgi:hypothetical protein
MQCFGLLIQIAAYLHIVPNAFHCGILIQYT